MINAGKKKNTVESLFVLIIFSIFAVTSLLLVVIGANVYRGIVDNTDANNEIRSSFSYISNKVRSSDVNGRVYITEDGEMKILNMDAVYGDVEYKTYIYYHEGYIKELFDFADKEFDPDKGEKILQIEAFDMYQTGKVLSFEASEKGISKLKLSLSLRCEYDK